LSAAGGYAVGAAGVEAAAAWWVDRRIPGHEGVGWDAEVLSDGVAGIARFCDVPFSTSLDCARLC
jgi:hypothetical protein